MAEEEAQWLSKQRVDALMEGIGKLPFQLDPPAEAEEKVGSGINSWRKRWRTEKRPSSW